MKSLIKIFLYLIFAVFIGAFLAPFFYSMILLLPADHFGIMGSLLSSVQQMPFHRYVSRTIQIVALVLLWPTIGLLKVKHLSDFFLYPNDYASSDFFKGVIAALVPIWLLEALFIVFKWYSFEGFCPTKIIFKIIITALAVAFLEEFLFRGILLGLCRRFLKNGVAVIFVALLFSGVHFLNLSHFQDSTIHWWSGFSLLFRHNVLCSDLPLAIGAFATLFLLGLLLGWATVTTESLWLAIGLHAGWVFAQQLFHAMTLETFSHLLPWWGPFQIHGMVPVGLLVILPLGITIFLVRKMVPQRTNVFSK